MVDDNKNVNMTLHTKETEARKQSTFSIDTIFVKDVSMETPKGHLAFSLITEAPKINLEFKVNTVKIVLPNDKLEADADGGRFESTLDIRVVATVRDETIYIIELQHAGIFTMLNIPKENLLWLQRVECPKVLFPFVRERIWSLVASAGFPAFYLPVISFESIFQQEQENLKNNPVQ